MISDDQLRRIMSRLPAAKRAGFLPHLNQAMREYGVHTMLRTAAFVAQLAHESGEFRWMEEIWGPTDAQRRYEPPTPLAKRLGNTEAGDGKRFKGRGPIQITGRDNYRRYGERLGLDLVTQPEQAATPAVAFAVAGLYWRSNGLNELADAEDFVTITKRINGGTNGLADRQKYYALARSVLAEGFVADPPPAVALPRGGARRSAAAVPPPAQEPPLARGHEVITRDAARSARSASTAAAATASGSSPAEASASARKPAAAKGAKPRAAGSRKNATGAASTSRSTVAKKRLDPAGAGRRPPAKATPAAARKATGTRAAKA